MVDSSSIVLPTELAGVWRGCGGSTGTNEATINRRTGASQMRRCSSSLAGPS